MTLWRVFDMCHKDVKNDNFDRFSLKFCRPVQETKCHPFTIPHFSVHKKSMTAIDKHY